VWAKPPPTAIQGPPPAICVGVVRDSVSPRPSCPLSFAPQHQSAPLVSMPQVCKAPVPIPVHVTEPPTGVGEARVSVSPVPSWPLLLSPQHQSVPSSRRAQVWRVVVESARQA
jgi:hypothetical protein